MADKTKIEWTDATWNPVRGCSKVSPGCKHCYAETFAERFRGVKGHPFEFGFDLRLAPDKLQDPIWWSQPRMIFVNSMSDLFHEDIPDDYIEAVCRVMLAANWHTYQVLTKRSKRLKQLLSKKFWTAGQAKHIWWGVSVEDRKHGFPRIDDLRDAPVAIRFLSVEPLIEDLGQINLQGIQWVIVGGESGAGARPIAPEWVKSIRAQCAVNEVAFFFKQWGGVRKHETGRELDGRTYSQFPKRVQRRPPSAEKRRALLAQMNELTSS